MATIKLKRQELKKILDFYSKFPDNENFIIRESKSNGLGTVCTISTEATLEGAKGTFQVELWGPDSW